LALGRFLDICFENKSWKVYLALKVKLPTEDSICFFLNALVGGVVAPNLRGFSFVDDRDWEQTWSRERDFPMISGVLDWATKEGFLEELLGFDGLSGLISPLRKSGFADATIKVEINL
jgi:hypothetical protein